MFSKIFNSFYAPVLLIVAITRAALLQDTISKHGFSFFSADILIYSAYFYSILNYYQSLTLVAEKNFRILTKNDKTMFIIDLILLIICLTIWVDAKNNQKEIIDFTRSFVFLFCQSLIVIYSRIKYITNLRGLCLSYKTTENGNYPKSQRTVAHRIFIPRLYSAKVKTDGTPSQVTENETPTPVEQESEDVDVEIRTGEEELQNAEQNSSTENGESQAIALETCTEREELQENVIETVA